jgi:hypothetical protein
LDVPFNTIPVRTGRLGCERRFGVELHEVATPAPEFRVADYAHRPEADVKRMANSGGVLWPEHGVGAPVSLCSEDPRFFGRLRHADSQIAVRWRGEHLVDVCVISGQIPVAL